MGPILIERNFEHAPTYDEHIGIAKSYIKSKIKQSVIIDGIEFYFEKDELIHTEVSRKYDDQVLKQILSKTDINGKIK